jgi:ribonuclease BN (tRNA processing enzyme)
MKLIVLGNYGSFPGKDGACSGYLLKDNNLNILIDCGNGVMSRLQRYCRIEELDAIILSHLHKDHICDMYILRYALEGKKNLNAIDKLINVYAPLTPENEYNSINFPNVFNINPISDGTEIEIKDVKFKFYRTDHSVETYGMRIEFNGKVLAYSSDTKSDKNIKQLALNSDLFLCESTATDRLKSSSNIPHISASQAANIAKEANVKALLLTHFYYEEERILYLEEASRIFSNTLLSEEFKEYDI